MGIKKSDDEEQLRKEQLLKERLLKKDAIKQIFLKLEEVGDNIRKNKELSARDQMTQVDVALDVMKFLKNYDENVKILNAYWSKKNWEDKFKDTGDR